jgi:hypothetical protein
VRVRTRTDVLVLTVRCKTPREIVAFKTRVRQVAVSAFYKDRRQHGSPPNNCVYFWGDEFKAEAPRSSGGSSTTDHLTVGSAWPVVLLPNGVLVVTGARPFYIGVPDGSTIIGVDVARPADPDVAPTLIACPLDAFPVLPRKGMRSASAAQANTRVLAVAPGVVATMPRPTRWSPPHVDGTVDAAPDDEEEEKKQRAEEKKKEEKKTGRRRGRTLPDATPYRVAPGAVYSSSSVKRARVASSLPPSAPLPPAAPVLAGLPPIPSLPSFDVPAPSALHRAIALANAAGSRDAVLGSL